MNFLVCEFFGGRPPLEHLREALINHIHELVRLGGFYEYS